jgi:hypothetical protein
MRYLFLALFSFSLLTSSSQKNKNINTNDLIMDCLKQGGEIPDRQMVVWYPKELWELIGKQMSGSQQALKIISEEMKNYVMFAVVDYHQGLSGLRFKSEAELRKTIRLYDSTGKSFLPLEQDQLSETARGLIDGMKPVLERMMGEFGEGMQLFLFDASAIKGVTLSDVSGHGEFSLGWENKKFSWRLPFASVLMPKKCPADGETMKGDWKFCPIHGVKLD